MTASVYIIQNKTNNKIYVGKSKDPEKRWRRHKTIANGGKEKHKSHYSLIHSAIDKYGFDNFTFYVIEVFDTNQDALEGEQFWIEYFRSWIKEYGYNLTMGGDGAKIGNKNRLGSKMSDKQKIIMSRAGVKLTNEHKLKISNKLKYFKYKNHKLKEYQVIEILELYSTGNHLQTDLAIKYDVSKTIINNIIKNKSWQHISRDAYIEPANKVKYKSICGSKNSSCILDKEKIIEIINIYNTTNINEYNLGNRYGVSEGVINRLINRKTYTDITQNIDILKRPPGYYKIGKTVNNKLTNSQLNEIIELYNSGDYTYKLLSEKFKISLSGIFSAINYSIRGKNR